MSNAERSTTTTFLNSMVASVFMSFVFYLPIAIELKGSYRSSNVLVTVRNMRQIDRLPKRLLNASDVIFSPVPLCNFFLANRNSSPVNPHDRNIVNIILIEIDLEARVMSLRPLIQSPALDNLGRFNKLEVFARNITAKQLVLSTFLCTLEELWSRACESSDTLRVGKSQVAFGSWGTELLCVGQLNGINLGARLNLGRI